MMGLMFGWQHGGSQGKFHWPGIRQGSELELDTEQLQALVLGLPWQRFGAGGAITLLQKL